MVALNTPNGVLSFPQLFAPKARAENTNPVFSCSILFDTAAQKTKEYKDLQQACVECAREKWGSNVSLASLMMPFRDGAQKEYAGYGEGIMYISPWSNNKPGIVDGRLQAILLPEEVWAGQLVRANVQPFAWLNSGKKGVSLGLNHIQIVKKDEPRIDGRASADKVFGVVDDGSDDTPF